MISSRTILWALVALTLCFSCDNEFTDEFPESYFMIQLNPDDIYLHNSADALPIRMDPLLNDSIKVDVTISYSTPSFGKISFIEDEGWFYQPNAGFYGLDNITYTVCYQDDCWSASITLYVEALPDPETCEMEIVGETVVTDKNTPLEIRIFANDIVCTYQGSSIQSPERGTFETYAYSGSIKNVVYVYYPPKNFTGTDRFQYKLFRSDGPDLVAYCTITVK